MAAPMSVATTVVEPDLSMEVQEELKRKLADIQKHCTHEEQERGSLNDAAYTRYARSAVVEMVATLRNFDPEVSGEKLSTAVHGLVHSEAVMGQLGPRLRGAVRDYVPRDRSAWCAADIDSHLAAKGARLRHLREGLARQAALARERVVEVASNKQLQVIVASGSTGAATLGTLGGVLGFASGACMGAAVGMLPAMLTFGLSVPVGATIGGGVGMVTGSTAGSFTGLLGCGATGGTIYSYRAEIGDGAVRIRTCALEKTAAARQRTTDLLEHTQTTAIELVGRARQKASEATKEASERFNEVAGRTKAAACSAADSTATKARQITTGVRDLAMDRKVQATAASAAGGAVVMGASGGIAGFATGGAVGAACGLIPAVFTFGLSIPVGAAVGSTVGLYIGTVAGGTTGLVSGGAAGYGLYARSDDLREGAAGAWTKASAFAESVREKAGKLISGTGGTA